MNEREDEIIEGLEGLSAKLDAERVVLLNYKRMEILFDIVNTMRELFEKRMRELERIQNELSEEIDGIGVRIDEDSDKDKLRWKNIDERLTTIEGRTRDLVRVVKKIEEDVYKNEK